MNRRLINAAALATATPRNSALLTRPWCIAKRDTAVTATGAAISSESPNPMAVIIREHEQKLRPGERLPLKHAILPSMLGSMALQQCLQMGLVRYRFLVFQKTG